MRLILTGLFAVAATGSAFSVLAVLALFVGACLFPGATDWSQIARVTFSVFTISTMSFVVLLPLAAASENEPGKEFPSAVDQVRQEHQADCGDRDPRNERMTPD